MALLIGAFFIGGLVFAAYQVSAVENGNGHKFGFWRSFSGIDKDSPEWQIKMEEFKAKREEFKASGTKDGEWKGHGLGFGHFIGLKGFRGMSDEVNYEVVNITNGVQITITSDNSDIVTKLQESAARFNDSE